MSHNRKSVFLKIKEYKGNPIDEYNKISQFIKKQRFQSIYLIEDTFSEYFKYCELLSSTYGDFKSCVLNHTRNLFKYKDKSFESIDAATQEILLNEFLDYCEILIYIQFTVHSRVVFYNFDSQVYSQLYELIKTSLKSMNYEIKLTNEDTNEVVVIKSNPEAEAVAAQSPQDLKEAIIYYLGSRDIDVAEKEVRLRTIIDKLEPLLEKYKTQSLIKKVREYIQLFRHPEMKKADPQYMWFYDDKSKYLDDIFMMCIFIKEYDITNNTISEFSELKKSKE